ncbi:polysaccharide biosynthesis protein [Mongoliitalea daihaiensis]|uniref:polysaccharide biosynthesis protein n=1 Tax=Mongoliitalea daihaiensis TaxID=2782006 RepID=UPI001F2A14D4|nr:nucleoside-diphosphate sugar epimerase/dehydratase [Mongoliitalea daihaiensis]UJP64441.1 polysaccharide biosynthesis protein [Mongoliitalea daihaiensis]
MDFLRRLTILPRWIIGVLDAGFFWLAGLIGYLTRFNFELDVVMANDVFLGSSIFMGAGILMMLFTHSYRGIVRHTGFKDGVIIAQTILYAAALLVLLNILSVRLFDHSYLVPTSVLIIASLTSICLLVFYRLVVKELFVYVRSTESMPTTKKGVIFGAGEAGIIVNNVIKRDRDTLLNIVAFLDDSINMEGKILHGKTIYRGLDKLEFLLEKYGITELIIAIKDLPIARKREIIDECLRLNIHVSTMPPVEQWINGNLDAKAIKDVKIEDLLSREQIAINNPQVQEDLQGKVILVTGAAGSIGSELCRQIIQYQPKDLILLDQAESPLYDMEQELKESGISHPFRVILGDVRDRKKMQQLFQQYKPQIVFHAAAYKHVPMMENYPEESMKTNILGTKNVADLSITHQVEKFVFVSTDKAVNPTNVMGATKRAAEMYVQSLSMFLEKNHSVKHTKFITTRFGNVLGSNGSVIPLFKKQIQRGGPVSVTHPDITRYFMTIPEACQLVLEAGVMGNGGEIFIFDMGQPIKIVDLAKKMIQLSGKKVGEDIEIVFSGLREGEKLYEELLNNSEFVKITHHPRIMIAQVAPGEYYKLEKQINLFEELIEKSVENDMVSHLKKIVPEFISKSSRFEILDRLN